MPGLITWCPVALLIIAGDYYVEYDVEKDEVMIGYPHKIRDDFSPDNASAEGIPDNLDSVHYDMVTKKMLFFKGDYVSMHWFPMTAFSLVNTSIQLARVVRCELRHMILLCFYSNGWITEYRRTK